MLEEWSLRAAAGAVLSTDFPSAPVGLFRVLSNDVAMAEVGSASGRGEGSGSNELCACTLVQVLDDLC